MSGDQGQDSPKLCYLSFQFVTLLGEKTVIVEPGESQPRLLSWCSNIFSWDSNAIRLADRIQLWWYCTNIL